MNKEIHLSPTGNDANTGTPDLPLASPEEALRRLGGGPGRLIFSSGIYPLDKTLRFVPGQSASVELRAAEPGKVIFDGGLPITGWQETTIHGVRAWVADLPEVRSGHWYFRQLFVDGRRAPRARFPKFGVTPSMRDNLFTMDEIRVLDATNKMTGGDFQFCPRPGDIGDWASLYDAEIVVPHFWLEERMTQLRVNPKTGWVESARRSIFALTAAFGPELAKYYVDNLFEALTEPGEWYLDRHTGRLTYLPLDGETVAQTEIYAPRLRSLVEVRGIGYNETKQFGDPCMDTPAGGGLVFDGIVFRHADWVQPIPTFGAHDKMPQPERPLAACGQSACDAPAAITLTLARDVTFRNCTVEHVGGYGIAIEQGCRRIAVEGCTLRDLGAGGIRINGAERDGNPWRTTGYCSITDNTIEAGGRVFHAGVGVLAMNTFENVIAHNHISDLFYSGISVGWSWGYKDTISRDNLILHNHVHDVGQGLLSDLGAIYVLGVQPGTVISGNHVHDIAKRHYGSIGIYLDEGASHILVEGNLVQGIQGACANVHFGRENSFRNNLLIAEPGHVALTIGKTEAHIAASVIANAFVLPGAAAFGGGYKGDPRRSFFSTMNLFFTPETANPAIWDDGHGERPATWKSWIAAGRECGSKILPLQDASAEMIAGVAAGILGRFETPWTDAGPRAPECRARIAQPRTREDRAAA